MGTTVTLTALALLLAAANGANDSFKGVATLHGAGSARYRAALVWATLTTLAGSLASLALAGALVARFSGKGLVPAALVADPALLTAVAAGAGATVWLASWRGLPVSTTHALTGALLGAGLVASGGAVRWTVLGGGFLLPLALSPLLAAGLALVTHRLASRLRRGLGIPKALCLCVGTEERLVPVTGDGPAACAALATRLTVSAGGAAQCEERYTGRVWRLDHQRLVDAAHWLSAGLVGFARGLNDTPKLVALLVGVQALAPRTALALVAVAMAGGALVAARRVAHTLSHTLAPIAPGRGLAASLVTAALVGGASCAGLPVSTTHCSVGAIAGAGLSAGVVRRRALAAVATAWLVTLPVAAVVAAAVWALTAA